MIDEIKQVETKRDMLIRTCDMLDKVFVRCVKDAEKKEDMSLLKKATALKRKCEETEAEVKALEDVLGVMNAKKNSLND